MRRRFIGGSGWRSRLELSQSSLDGGFERGHALFKPGFECAHALLKLGLERGDALFHLGVEPLKVQLVERPEVGPIRGVHLIEPLHQLIGDVIAKSLIESA